MADDIFKEPFHCVTEDGKKFVWSTKRLWKLAENLPVFEFEISSFDGMDKDFWFGDRNHPTIRNVLQHFDKIQKADLRFPIIISQHGLIMDGVHRICRAYVEGKKVVRAVRFEVNPAPDEIIVL